MRVFKPLYLIALFPPCRCHNLVLEDMDKSENIVKSFVILVRQIYILFQFQLRGEVTNVTVKLYPTLDGIVK